MEIRDENIDVPTTYKHLPSLNSYFFERRRAMLEQEIKPTPYQNSRSKPLLMASHKITSVQEANAYRPL